MPKRSGVESGAGGGSSHRGGAGHAGAGAQSGAGNSKKTKVGGRKARVARKSKAPGNLFSFYRAKGRERYDQAEITTYSESTEYESGTNRPGSGRATL